MRKLLIGLVLAITGASCMGMGWGLLKVLETTNLILICLGTVLLCGGIGFIGGFVSGIAEDLGYQEEKEIGPLYLRGIVGGFKIMPYLITGLVIGYLTWGI